MVPSITTNSLASMGSALIVPLNISTQAGPSELNNPAGMKS